MRLTVTSANLTAPPLLAFAPNSLLRKAGLLLLCLTFACFVLVPFAPLRAQDVTGLVMVVGKGSSAGPLSAADAKRILLGETNTWRNGDKVLVLMKAPGSAERVAVLKKVCGMTETMYTRFELQTSFTGAVPATVTIVPTSAAVKAALATNPSAIGFLHKSEVDASVKVVLSLD